MESINSTPKFMESPSHRGAAIAAIFVLSKNIVLYFQSMHVPVDLMGSIINGGSAALAGWVAVESGKYILKFVKIRIFKWKDNKKRTR
jgi:hypothetical protein